MAEELHNQCPWLTASSIIERIYGICIRNKPTNTNSMLVVVAAELKSQFGETLWTLRHGDGWLLVDHLMPINCLAINPINMLIAWALSSEELSMVFGQVCVCVVTSSGLR